jgi:hypothetical protein
VPTLARRSHATTREDGMLVYVALHIAMMNGTGEALCLTDREIPLLAGVEAAAAVVVAAENESEIGAAAVNMLAAGETEVVEESFTGGVEATMNGAAVAGGIVTAGATKRGLRQLVAGTMSHGGHYSRKLTILGRAAHPLSGELAAAPLSIGSVQCKAVQTLLTTLVVIAASAVAHLSYSQRFLWTQIAGAELRLRYRTNTSLEL